MNVADRHSNVVSELEARLEAKMATRIIVK
jgi:hypothetical protein